MIGDEYSCNDRYPKKPGPMRSLVHVLAVDSIVIDLDIGIFGIDP